MRSRPAFNDRAGGVRIISDMRPHRLVGERRLGRWGKRGRINRRSEEWLRLSVDTRGSGELIERGQSAQKGLK
jgi:hypothetical protein